MPSIEDRKKRIISAFNSLNKDNLDVLDSFYDNSIEFTDPVTSVKGLPQAKKYYAHSYQNVISIHFDFLQINNEADLYFAKWNMHLQAKNLNPKKPFIVEGLSVLKFGSNDKVISHRDYLDLGSLVYEKLPVLGAMIRRIKKTMQE